MLQVLFLSERSSRSETKGVAAADYELSQLWVFYCYCFWLERRVQLSLSYSKPSLHPTTSNPLASDNTNHKNPVEPITSFSDAVYLANRVLTLSLGRCAYRLANYHRITAMITLFDLHWVASASHFN